MALTRLRSLTQLLKKPQILALVQTDNAIHTTSVNNAKGKRQDDMAPKHWLTYNDVIYPPQKPGEAPRPAVSNIMYLNMSFYTLINC